MYDAGGFFLPFAVTGTAILLSGFAVLATVKVGEIKRRHSGSSFLRIFTMFEEMLFIAV
jgi:hypothetical protein